MRPRGMQHRMHASRREPRRYLRHELEWGSQEESLERTAVLVVVVGFVARRRESKCDKRAAVILESRRGDDAIRIGPALAAEALERDRVVIPWLQIGVEIDLTREDLCHRDSEIDTFAGRFDRLEQRR